MGLLVDGVWKDQWYDTGKSGGKFERQASRFRDWVTADGKPGPGSTRSFKAEPGRYHLYVSYACPWAHRTLIVRKLKKLEDAISVSVVHHFMGENGWTFLEEDGATGDTLFGLDYLHQVYTKADPSYTGRVTVPVLWDKREGTIVSNESSEIIRMLNSAFDGPQNGNGDASIDLYPQALRAEIDAVNSRVYDSVNNGVYKAGFATTQAAYEQAFTELFGTLDWLDDRLSRQRYLAGSRMTEADWRLFTTLIRFDAVYVGHFKCNLRRIDDYPNLSGYLRELYQVPGVAGTVNMLHIKRHYYASHEMVNPTHIVPAGPALDFDRPHDRDRLPLAA
jgi:putative glutathione S-transferase